MALVIRISVATTLTLSKFPRLIYRNVASSVLLFPNKCYCKNVIRSDHSKFKVRYLSSKSIDVDIEYNQIADETLDELTNFFEDLGDSGLCNKEFDVQYESGVLTIHLGENHGTYVINKQTPNKQIWLSSPLSGPKRYQVVDGKWIYPHDGISLHETLSHEFSKALHTTIDLTKLYYAHFTNKNSWI